MNDGEGFMYKKVSVLLQFNESINLYVITAQINLIFFSDISEGITSRYWLLFVLKVYCWISFTFYVYDINVNKNKERHSFGNVDFVKLYVK